jgi:hypothetical protein
MYSLSLFFFKDLSMGRRPLVALLRVLCSDGSESMTRNDIITIHSEIGSHKLDSGLLEVIQSLFGAPFPQIYVLLILSELLDHGVYIIHPIELAFGRIPTSPATSCR